DYLVVDMPPGTGDAQLSLVQTIEIAGAVMVTTPQDVATGDVRRAIRMFERVRAPVLGVVENMSGFSCPHCGGHADIFGRGGGQRLAEDMHVPFLGEIPLDVQVREAGDSGRPTVISAPDSPAGRALREIAEQLVATLEGALAGRPCPFPRAPSWARCSRTSSCGSSRRRSRYSAVAAPRCRSAAPCRSPPLWK